MPTDLTIVNKDLQFEKVSLIEPSTSAYLHIAAEVDTSPVPIFLFESKKKKQLIARCKQWCKELEEKTAATSAVVFKAKLIPPGKGKFLDKRVGQVHVGRYDVAILIEAPTQEDIHAVVFDEIYQQMEAATKEAASYTHIVSASNARRIGPVNHSKPGIFLFNYFFADRVEQNLSVWEYTAGWFQQETGLDNSVLLLPVDSERSEYAVINHCRWDSLRDIVPSILFKRSFHKYVLDNFEANNVAAIPILYTLA